jgi:hypothetical protein
MPRGPIGEKRRADVIGNAMHVMKIATGEIDEGFSKKFENHGHTSRMRWPPGGERLAPPVC